MGYSVDIEKINEYLHVTARGDKSLANILSYLEKVYDACIHHRCSNVLIEDHMVGPKLDSYDIFVVISKNVYKAKTVGLRLAFVNMNTVHDTHGLKFGENLAHIRGMNVRVFYDSNTPEMVAWLLGNQTKSL